MRRGLLASALLALACAASAPLRSANTLVDLSHVFDAETIYWPGEDGFVLEPSFAGVTEAGYWYAANRFRAAEHGGTHLDAPIHFAAGRRSVDSIPVDRLVGPAVVVDVSRACARDRDHAVTVRELFAWEQQHGRLPQGAIVLLHTGFGRFWPDRERYLDTAKRGPEGVAELHFPGLHPDAARWLVEQRAIRLVGIDTASIDPGTSQGFESHRILFEHDVPALENLANLDRLPATGFEVVALPMKIRAGTGAPLRAIAIVPSLP